jgi:hypothetical protein
MKKKAIIESKPRLSYYDRDHIQTRKILGSKKLTRRRMTASKTFFGQVRDCLFNI